MIICSCNYLSSEDILSVINIAQTEQEILDMLAWTPECATCESLLRSEVKRIIKEVKGELQD